MTTTGQSDGNGAMPDSDTIPPRTIAEERAAERRDHGLDWIDRLRRQMRGETEPEPLTAADRELHRRTT